MKIRPANLLLERHISELGLNFVREYKFHPTRLWKFDYVLSPPEKVHLCAVEIEGGLYVNGGHSRGKAYELNLEKYNAAVAMNWTLFRFSTGQVLRGEAKQFLADWLGLGVNATVENLDVKSIGRKENG